MKSLRFYVISGFALLSLTTFTFTRTSSTFSHQESNSVKITNRTSAFQVTAAQRIDNDLNISLTNNYSRRITAFVITMGKHYRITEDLITSEVSDEVGIKPQETFQRRYPITSPQFEPLDITLEAVVFDDKTGDGNPVIFDEIRDSRFGRGVQIKRTVKLLEKYLDSLNDGSPDGNVGKLKSEVEMALNRPETETLIALKEIRPPDSISRNDGSSLSDFAQEGLEAGKADALRRVNELEHCANRKDALLKLTTYYQKLLERL